MTFTKKVTQKAMAPVTIEKIEAEEKPSMPVIMRETKELLIIKKLEYSPLIHIAL